MARTALRNFALAHPYCCFCGGEQTTESRDEVPPRSMFVDRIWPEGYQFPACENCNQGSRHIDQVLALFTRMSFADRRQGEETLTPYISGVINNSPELMPKIANSSIEARKLLRQLGIQKPEGTFAKDFPVALIPKETIDALNHFFKKLFCALYYKHTNRILPNRSPVAIVKSTNQIYDDPNPFDWLHQIPFSNAPKIARSGKDLSDQFDYLWQYNREEDLFGFSFQLRYSLFGIMCGPISDAQPSDWPDGSLIWTGL